MGRMTSVRSLREWLEVLDTQGVLRHVNREVDRTFELAALGKLADGICALRFDRVPTRRTFSQ